MPAVITSIEKDSIAQELEIQAGSELLSINGVKLKDYIEYVQAYVARNNLKDEMKLDENIYKNSFENMKTENAKLNEADIQFIRSDMFEHIDDKFDLIVSNPPYIKSEDVLTLQKEVKDFEPKLALDGGVDGYDYYRIIAKKSGEHLNDGGVLLLECGVGQAQTIAELLSGFNKVEIIKDYENIDRIVKAVI